MVNIILLFVVPSSIYFNFNSTFYLNILNSFYSVPFQTHCFFTSIKKEWFTICWIFSLYFHSFQIINLFANGKKTLAQSGFQDELKQRGIRIVGSVLSSPCQLHPDTTEAPTQSHSTQKWSWCFLVKFFQRPLILAYLSHRSSAGKGKKGITGFGGNRYEITYIR